MGWAWLIILLATYPWLLAADLAGDSLASSSLVVFVSGACLIAPCRRLKRWQCVLFAAALGFLFEARRPIPDGALAITLVAVAIYLSSNRPLLRSTPRMLQGAAIVNIGACLVWYLAAAFTTDAPSDGAAGHLFGQLLLAGVVGAVGLVPVALTQNAVMDRAGVPPAPEQR
jgi:hypothetical protein